MALKPGPKRTATSTGKPDQRQRDNKSTPGNTPSLKPSKSSEKKYISDYLNEPIFKRFYLLKFVS